MKKTVNKKTVKEVKEKMPSSPGFSPATAAIFIFNLVVGTGALALPNAFEQAPSSLLAPTGALYVTMQHYKLTEKLM